MATKFTKNFTSQTTINLLMWEIKFSLCFQNTTVSSFNSNYKDENPK